MRARERGRKSVVVGDRVALVGDVSGDADALARIVRIEERTSVLRRTADDDDPYERVIVANADQLVIVTALADPPPRTGFIDRPGRRVRRRRHPGTLPDQGRPGVAGRPPGRLRGARPGRGDVPLRRAASRTRGPARRPRLGTGQALRCRQVHAGERTRAGAPGHRRGDRCRQGPAHLHVGGGPGTAGGGWVIDTPGVRSFGLAHVSPASLLAGFRDLAEGAEGARRGANTRRRWTGAPRRLGDRRPRHSGSARVLPPAARLPRGPST